MDEKIQLVERHKDDLGLNRCLRALGVSKGTWHYRQTTARENEAKRRAEEAALKEDVEDVIEEHPAYGYRRIGPELEESFGRVVGETRLRRLLNGWDLSLMREVTRPEPSGVRQILNGATGQLDLVKGWQPGPLEMLSCDFTEIRYANGAKRAHFMAMVDPACRWVPGWATGESANRALALRCWQWATERLGEAGVDAAGLVVHSDQDSVYTSYDWLRALLIDAGVVVSFSENGAKGNPWVESFWSRFKQENHSLLLEADTLEELREIIDRQMRYYNRERRHSGLAYQSPIEYLRGEGILPTAVSRN